MKVSNSASNKNFYLTIFEHLKKGETPTKISKKLNISKQNLNYYLRKLKDKGFIRKKGYGVWEINPTSKKVLQHTMTRSKNPVRGHAFIWKVKLHKKIDWKSKLRPKEYKLVRGYTPRIYVGNKKVWLGKKSIVIYDPNSFYGKNAIESKKYAVFNLLETIRKIESKLNVNLRPYVFNSSREHYGLIRNELAIQCNKKGEKIHIVDDGKEWLWIDDSFNLGELETGGEKALVNNVGVQNWWNDMKRTKFEWTPTVIGNTLGGVVEVQQMHSQNIIKHQRVLDEMLITLKEIRNSLRLKNDKKHLNSGKI